MTYTIKEIADLAGVTTRMMRYYAESGLLSVSLLLGADLVFGLLSGIKDLREQ